MALNGDQLGQEIASAVMDGAATPEAQAAVIALWQKVGNAITAHFVKNGEVPAGIAVATSGGAGATSAPGKIT